MKEITQLNQIIENVKSQFVDKNEIVDLLAIGLIARENAFLYGPPGTAKSAIVRTFSKQIKGRPNFEYLLTRFTEPNEIFGPFDIRKLKEGELVTNTEGMLPEASLVFLDELFNANSAILNSLLMSLNERVYRRGKETTDIPALMFVGASNAIPEDEALNALYDRFLIRVKCDNVAPIHLESVLNAGWAYEKNNRREVNTFISDEEIKNLQHACKSIDLSNIIKPYVELIHSLRNAGIKISDRRAVKIQNLVAASALLCDRNYAVKSDLWVLKYVWDTEEQVEILESIVNNVIQNDEETKIHPQAYANKVPDAENLMAELKILKSNWLREDCTLEEKNRIKDSLRHLQTRCDWVKKPEQRTYLQNEIDGIWKTMLNSL